MSKVLIITASPTAKEKSHTIAIVDHFLKHYTAKNPNDELIRFDLNDDPEITSNVLNNHNFNEFFTKTDKYIDQLKSVDKLVLATPMNNFNVSTMLKNYIDHIMVAGKTFKYKYDGKGVSEGLVTNLKVQILASQGAPCDWYVWGALTGYLKGCFNFIGAKVCEPVLIAGTQTKEYRHIPAEEIAEKFDEEIKQAACNF